MRQSIFKLNFLLSLFIFSSLLRESYIIRTIKILREFPSENQMERDNFTIGYALKFALTDKYIFICDNKEHNVKRFDHFGNYKGSFGRPGQGPGDFKNPFIIESYKNDIYITDQGSLRIQIFNQDGELKKVWNLTMYAMGLGIAEDKIMILSPNYKFFYNEDTPLFIILDINGRIIKNIAGYFSRSSQYKQKTDLIMDNMVTIRAHDNMFHVLQQYGTGYRVYDLSGNIKHQVYLNKDPRTDEDYKKLKFLYSYPTFDIYEENIYAHRISRGGIDIDVFNKEGKYIETYRCELNRDETYYVSDMRIVTRENRKYFYLLLVVPENKIIIAEW